MVPPLLRCRPQPLPSPPRPPTPSSAAVLCTPLHPTARRCGARRSSRRSSPRTPSTCGREVGGGGALDLPSAAAAAAARYPALVPYGGAGCFAGTVADVGPRAGSRGGKLRLWLSEPAMVGAGLRPGCLVSASLISSRNDQLDSFPFDSLFEECNRFFDLDVDNDLMCNEAGRNFVVATVFPSREVQKNGIKLSWRFQLNWGKLQFHSLSTKPRKFIFLIHPAQRSLAQRSQSFQLNIPRMLIQEMKVPRVLQDLVVCLKSQHR